MIQRYSIETPPFAKGYMVPDDNGKFCRYEERFDSDPDVPCCDPIVKHATCNCGTDGYSTSTGGCPVHGCRG